MTVQELGDAAFIVRELPGPAYAYAASLLEQQHPKILDAAASYETLGIYTDPGAMTSEEVKALIQSLHAREIQPRRHEIPVCYELGDDLKDVALTLGLTTSRFTDLHASTDYRCFAVGFCPGFPYLGWLPKELQGIPRRPTPRVSTEPGSVGMTGRQTGIYSLPRPGGWPVIGKTPLTIVNVDEAYFPIRAGDLVRFHPIGLSEFHDLKGRRL